MKKIFCQAPNQLISILIASLLFIVPLFFLNFTRDYFEINKMFLVYFLALMILGIIAFNIIKEKRIIIPRSTLWWPAIILLFVWILATIFSIHPYTSLWGNPWRFNGGLISILTYFIFFATAIIFIKSDQLIFYIKAIVFSSTLVAIVGLLQYFHLIEFLPNELPRVGSTLGQANFLASFLLVGFFLTIYLVYQTNNRGKILYSIFLIPILGCFALTNSRGALLGLIFGLIFLGIFIALKQKKYFCFLRAVIIFLVVIIGSIPSLRERVSGIRNLEPTGTAYARLYAWKGAVKITINHPLLGTGPETFLYALPALRDPKLNYNLEDWTRRFDKAHNEFLNLASTTGFFGLLSFLFLLVMVFRACFRLIQRGASIKEKILPVSLLAGLISLLVASFFGFLIVSTSLLIWFIFAIVAILENNYLFQNKTIDYRLKFFSSGWLQKNFILLILILIIITFYFLGKIYLAEVNFSGGNYQKAAELNPKIDIYWGTLAAQTQNSQFALKAIEINPKNSDNWLIYAEIEKNYLKAKEAMTKAITLDPSNASIYYRFALLAKNNQDFETAKNNLKEALKLKENYYEAKDLLKLIQD